MINIKIIIMIITLFICSCIQSGTESQDQFQRPERIKSPTHNRELNRVNNSSHLELTDYDYEINSLSYSEFSSYLNNQTEFTYMNIFIRKKTNDRLYYSDYGFGNLAGNRHYSDVEYMDCDMIINYIPGGEPYYYCEYSVDFTPYQMESLLTYIDTHHEYFFNHEEFNGMQLPFVNEAMSFDYKNYSFGVIIYLPDLDPYSTIDPIKIINKNVDELDPNSPLYGLFQLWEDEHLPLILNGTEYCW